MSAPTPAELLARAKAAVLLSRAADRIAVRLAKELRDAACAYADAAAGTGRGTTRWLAAYREAWE